MSLGWLSSRHLYQFCTCIFSQLVKQVINKFIASLYCSACSTPFSRGIGICENKKYRGVYVRYMPRASCPGCSGGVEDKKGDLAIRLWNLIICIENVDAKCWLAEMTLVITSLPLGTCTFELVSRPFALIWWKSDSSVDGESHGRIGCGIQIRDL